MLSKVCSTYALIVALLLLPTLPAQASINNPKEDFSKKELVSEGQFVKHVKMHKKMVSITFDDGPDPRYTKQIIEILNKYNAKATFFVIGKKAKQHPELLKMELENGNEIGNHSYSHRLSKNIKVEDIAECDQIVFSVTKQHTMLFRPPGGFISPQILESANQANELVVTWSWDEDSRDWSKPGVHKITKRVLNHLHPGDIILFHDGGGRREQTVEALPQILQGIQEQGFECVTVSELLRNYSSK